MASQGEKTMSIVRPFIALKNIHLGAIPSRETLNRLPIVVIFPTQMTITAIFITYWLYLLNGLTVKTLTIRCPECSVFFVVKSSDSKLSWPTHPYRIRRMVKSVLSKEKKTFYRQVPNNWRGWLVGWAYLKKVFSMPVVDFENLPGRLILNGMFGCVNIMSVLTIVRKPGHRKLNLSSPWCFWASSAIGQVSTGWRVNVFMAFSLDFLA